MAEKKVINLEINDNLKSFKQQLKEAQAEVVSLSDKFGATSKEAINAAKRAAELKDAIGDAKALTDAFNPDAKFNALSGSIGGVLNGFSAFEGALGLVGAQGKEVEEALLKVQSAMALSQGIQGLMEAKDTFKQLGAVIGETFKGLKGALLATGIGAFIVLVGTLAANWDKVSESLGLSNKRQEALNESMDDYKKGATEAISKTQKVKSAFDLARQGVISKEEALQTYNDTLGESFGKATSLNEAEKLYTDKTDAYIKATALRAQSQALFAKAAEEQANALSAQLSDQTSLTDKLSAVSITGEINYKKLAKAQKKGIEDAKKDAQERAKIFEDEAARLLKEAETVENANNIKSESEIKLSNQKKEINTKEVDARKEALAEIEAAEKAFNESKLTNEELEILRVEEKYSKLIELAKKYNEDITLLEQARHDEIARIVSDNTIELQRIDVEAKDQQIVRDDESNKVIESMLFAMAAKKKAIREQEEKDEQVLNNQKIQGVQNALSAISSLAELFAGKTRKQQERAFKVQKAVQIAQTTIDTYKAAQGAFSSLSSIPIVGPILGGVAAAAAVAAGVLNIKKIASTKFDSNGGASPTPSAGGGGGAAIGGGGGGMTPQFNLVGAGGENPLQNLGNKEPVKAYVVGKEVTTQQSLDRNIAENAVL